jgi:hypothetical protein
VTESQILDFVTQVFKSVWPLELLVVLYQHADQSWSIDTLAREIRANASVANRSLGILEGAGLISVGAGKTFRFEPRSPELASLVGELVDLYTRKPRTVMHAIFSNPQDKIQTFSDAFIIRKDPC